MKIRNSRERNEALKKITKKIGRNYIEDFEERHIADHDALVARLDNKHTDIELIQKGIIYE